MALPIILGAVSQMIGGLGAGGPLGAVAGLKKKMGIGVTKKRRRRARLTHAELMELNQVKNILGRTAAANALPYYLGRGR